MPVVADSEAVLLTARIAGLIRKRHLAGEVEGTHFLPSERTLAGSMQVSRTTVRHALRMLEEDGLVRAEHGRGYRRLPKAAGLSVGGRIAILRPEGRLGISDALAASLQDEALARGAQLLTLGPAELSTRSLADALLEAKAWGVVLTLDDPALHRAVAKAGVPCVAVDCASRERDLDYIMQDNFGGAMQAAEFLVAKGHRRIAWFGPLRDSAQSLERFAGAGSVLTRHGLEWPSGLVVTPGKDLDAAATELLSHAERPAAVLALWRAHALAMQRAARRLKREIDLVSWSDEAAYRAQRDELGDCPPPTVVWSTAEMARIAIARLEWQLRDRTLNALRMSVPTRLALPGQDLSGDEA